MSAKKATNNISPEILANYNRLVETIPAVERKGATVPYTSLNGNMFSFLNSEGRLGLRLPETARENFLTKYKTALCVEYGTVMKEYVAVPADLLNNTEELKEYFLISYEYVKTLKPKPTKK